MSISEAMIIRASGEYDCEVVVNLKLEGLSKSSSDFKLCSIIACSLDIRNYFVQCLSGIRNITCLETSISLVDLSLARNEVI